MNIQFDDRLSFNYFGTMYLAAVTTLREKKITIQSCWLFEEKWWTTEMLALNFVYFTVVFKRISV